ncbi:alpha/beta hydrolase family protein [Hydrogenophaga sp. RAC07]|uniref:alpha/beta fold hydrolase n=1 Tax=Hydrogenophaga sp. RAC07 TaxID=1842537 RepID=UPI00083CA8F3|nr:alpha/beta fold hydrolase [Hydrogenophaga sp. RAC07]AOF84022.1 alpha/beta hydrolase family protein [Hydrogenophaga sp. RAC07]
MNRIDISGVGIEVAHLPGASDRAPLVFLHEGLGSISMWRQRGRLWPAELCAATGRAGWMYSRRGYGQSDPVADVRGPPRRDGAWHIGRHEPDYMHLEAHDVLPQVLDRLGISNPVLVGHSDGATIALLHASQHPVTACVAMAPHVFVEPMAVTAIEQAKQLFETTPDAADGLRQRLARHHRDVDNAFWQWNDVWLSEAFQAFDIRTELRGLAAHLLLVQGVDDEYGSLEQLAAIRREVPQAIHIELQSCGHTPHRDHPDQLLAGVRAFLGSIA